MYPKRVIRSSYVLSALAATRKCHPSGLRNNRGFPPLSWTGDNPRRGAQASRWELPGWLVSEMPRSRNRKTLTQFLSPNLGQVSGPVIDEPTAGG